MARLTCKNHPDLRWYCKDIAITNGGYNGTRNLFFQGMRTLETATGDGSYKPCDWFYIDANGVGRSVHECDCSAEDLVLIAE